ncbi:MAG TPA: hypothetical protein DCF43_06340 [Pseudomonas sp.]|nr:hypothetical protein [Pseudomonas sp.]
MSWSAGVLISLVWFLAGYNIGWIRAYTTVADECERLGGFYVGKLVFKCSAIERAAKPQVPPVRNPTSPPGDE